MSAPIQGWFNYAHIYRRMVDECRHGGTIIELGVWKGASLCYLAQIAAAKEINVYGIDAWKHDEWDGYQLQMLYDNRDGETRTPHQQCEDNLKACGARATLIKSDCIAAAELFRDGYVDFLFIDDTHDSEHIERELLAWLPKLRRPTWIAGHDFKQVLPGVLRVLPDATHDDACWIANLP